MNKRFHLLLIFIAASFWLVQCVPSPAIMPTTTPENTATITFTPTENPSPTITRRPSATPSLTPLPSLGPEQVRAKVFELLKSNGGCELPCWWGIMPGTTTRSETEQILRGLNLGFMEYDPLDFNGGLPGFDRSFILGYPDGALDIHVVIRMQNDIVYFIDIRMSFLSTHPDVRSPNFVDAVGDFVPENMIPAFGVPSHVRIDNSYGPGEGPPTYAEDLIFINYTARGITLRYDIWNKLSSKDRVCPTFGIEGNVEDDIALLLISPGKSDPEDDQFNFFQSSANPIEKAAGLTSQDFYDLYMQSVNPVCFYTLPDIWP
jgi:hypothetical protein